MMTNKNNLLIWVLVVLVFIGGLIYITHNKTNKNNMTSTTEDEMAAQAGDLVSMNYTGKLTDGTVFDSNVDPKFGHVQPFEFVLGQGQVIAGWDKGIVGMKAGDKKHIEIRPEDAYGTVGVKDPRTGEVVIPPNATLVFDVELIRIRRQ